MPERFNIYECYPEGHGTDFAWDVGFSLCGSDHRGDRSVSEH